MDYKYHGTRWSALSAFLLLLIVSCSEDAAGPAGSIPGYFESTVTAGAHDSVVYTPGNTLSIEVISIEDSRCPADAICIWGGVAQVEFFITGIGQDIILYAGGGNNSRFPSTTAFLFLGRFYELTLLDVTPYPTIENSEINQKAHFSVRRLGK